jgi:hypothetical protein
MSSKTPSVGTTLFASLRASSPILVTVDSIATLDDGQTAIFLTSSSDSFNENKPVPESDIIFYPEAYTEAKVCFVIMTEEFVFDDELCKLRVKYAFDALDAIDEAEALQVSTKKPHHVEVVRI